MVRDKGRFVKGQSGNPGGRKRTDTNLIELARAHTEEAFFTIVGVMRDIEAKGTERVKAAQIVLEYGHGKPSQTISLEGNEQGPIIVIRSAKEGKEEWLAQRGKNNTKS